MAKIIFFLLAISTALSNLFGANMNIKISETKLQEIDGFGTSACWWAQMMNDDDIRSNIVKELFSKDGLGLNIYRYNIGGGTNPEKNRIGGESRRTESFYYYNESTKSMEYDWNRDKNAMATLKEALSYGCVDTVVLFANSPHYSMTKNGETIASKENETNIAPEKYADFVDYFLTITEHFIKEGIPVKYISPINEPQWKWGGDWVSQEGCHYEPDEVVALIKLFAEEIEARNLPVKLSVPDSGALGKQTQKYFTSLYGTDVIRRNTASYAYHSYWADTNTTDKINLGVWRDVIFKHAKLEMTEWCELPCKHDISDIGGAIVTARVMANDIGLSHVNSWTSWVGVNTTGYDNGKAYSDAYFAADGEDFSKLTKTQRYYAMAHFSKFVPVGSYVLKSSSNISDLLRDEDGNKYFETSYVAFRTPEGKTVLIIVHEGNDREIKLTFPSKNDIKIYTTDETQQLSLTYDGPFKKTLTVTKNSINTIVMD